MNKKDLKAVLLASALCGAAAVVPVMADEVEQDPVDVQDQVLDTSNDGNAITNDSGVVENTEASGDATENLESDPVVNEGSDFSETETTTVVSQDESKKMVGQIVIKDTMRMVNQSQISLETQMVIHIILMNMVINKPVIYIKEMIAIILIVMELCKKNISMGINISAIKEMQ